MPMTQSEAESFLDAPDQQSEQPATPKLGAFTQQQAEDFLGPDTTPQPVDDFGRFVPQSSQALDDYVAQSSIGKVLNAFGQGVRQGWGAADLGLDPTTEASLKQAGILPDVQKGQGGLLRAFNEAIIRPTAAALDAASRLPSAVIAGGQAAVAEAGAQVGMPELGRDIAALPEAFPAGFDAGIPRVPDLEAAHDAGVIGAPEAAFKGTHEAPLPSLTATAEAIHEQQHPASTYAEGALGPTEQAAPVTSSTPTVDLSTLPTTDVHGLARAIAPQTFDEYDALTAHRDDLRQQIEEQTDTLRQQAEAQAPHAAEIADLERRLQDTTPRLAKKYQARLDELTPARDAFLNDEFTMGALTRDTPEIGALRQQLLETDFRMRDLAPEVSEAHRPCGGAKSDAGTSGRTCGAGYCAGGRPGTRSPGSCAAGAARECSGEAARK